jgi:diguanylate cyclase (GGDEF)-like protein/PAS domain S-box-containing protein
LKKELENPYQLYEMLPVGIMITNPDRNIIFLNKAAKELTGYSDEEISGHKCDLLFGNVCLKSGEGCCYEKTSKPKRRPFELTTRQGERIVVDKIERTMASADGRVTGAVEMFAVASHDDSMTVEIRRDNERLNKYLSQLEDLLDVGLMITSSLSIHRVLLRIINILRTTFNYERIFILIPNEDGELEVAARTSESRANDPVSEKIEIKMSSALDSLKKKKVILVNDTANQKGYIPFVNSSRSELFVQMTAREINLGALIATSSKPLYFTKRDMEILSKIANFAAAAINNAQLTALMKTARDQYETLFNKSSDPIVITNKNGDQFLDINIRCTEVYGYSRDEFLKMYPLMIIEGDNKTSTELQNAFISDWEGTHITKDKNIIYVETRTAEIEYAGQKANLTIIRDISERKKFEEELQKLSITDELTQLFNRYYFIQTLQNEIERAKRYNQSLSLMMIDVDKFKFFNDKYGHQAGDKLLSDLGVILCTNLRSTDVPCRYGGDEFSLILPHTTENDAEIIAQRILNAFSKTNYNETGLSIGVSCLAEDDTEESLIRKADQALYYVKKELGKGKIVLFHNIT